MKALSIMLIYTLLLARVFAQTIVSGNQSGTWTTSGSPYIVTGNVTVVNSLRIEPGVSVKFEAGNWRLDVGDGNKMVAKGTPENPIIFEPFQGQNPGLWNTIYFLNSQEDDTLQNCIIRYATNGITIRDTKPAIANCKIYSNLQNGIYLPFRNPSEGLQITECDLYDNGSSGIRLYGFEPDNGQSMSVDCRFYKCRIYNNNQNGITIYSDTNWLNGYSYVLARIINCTIFGHTNGVLAYSNRGNSDAKVLNSIITFNTTSAIINENSGGLIGENDITYNCFWSNGPNQFINLRDPIAGFGDPSTNINANGDSCDINFNIYYDPAFVDTPNANFHLQGSSRCIDAGTPIILGQYVLDPDSTLPDMGAYYFPQLVSIENGIAELPGEYLLQQNYPNPFNPSTTIRFTLPKATQVRLTVFNALGEQVAEALNEHKPAGVHTVAFDGRNLSSGVYYYRIEAGEFREVKRMFVVR